MPATLPVLPVGAANYPPAINDALITAMQSGLSVIRVAVGFGTANNAVLYTAEERILLVKALWEVTAAFTGGASSAIGLSSSNSAYSTAGDLLGGASGDVLAGLTVGFRGTVGAKLASEGVVVLAAGDTVKFNRITSAFTAGAGYVHLLVVRLPDA